MSAKEIKLRDWLFALPEPPKEGDACDSWRIVCRAVDSPPRGMGIVKLHRELGHTYYLSTEIVAAVEPAMASIVTFMRRLEREAKSARAKAVKELSE